MCVSVSCCFCIRLYTTGIIKKFYAEKETIQGVCVIIAIDDNFRKFKLLIFLFCVCVCVKFKLMHCYYCCLSARAEEGVIALVWTYRCGGTGGS